jgi:DNA-directed RNA polymerase specialized sigma24 family protein
MPGCSLIVVITCELEEDTGLTIWEDKQWVTQVLASLSPAQREVMAFIVDDFTPGEVAALLGKTPAAVRQNMCAARHRLARGLPQNRQHGPHSPGAPRREDR